MKKYQKIKYSDEWTEKLMESLRKREREEIKERTKGLFEYLSKAYIIGALNLSDDESMKKYSKISHCRICKNKELETIGSLGDLYINDFPSTSKMPLEAPHCPLELVLCNKCNLLQLAHIINPEELYSDFYWYKSGNNQAIVQDLKEIAKQAIKMADIRKGDIFLDIGANDGTLLSFVPKIYERYGVEPAKNLIDDLRKHTTAHCSDFWEDVDSLPDKRKAKIITAIGMFYDSEDPNLFIGNVKKHLTRNGIFIAQLMTLKPMIENNDVGNICHEHLEYYSYKSLVYLFEKNGLEIFKVEENNINGGSYRLFARHYKTGSVKYPEPKYDYKHFFAKIKINKELTTDFIKDKTKNGYKVFAYGASTKGNTVLQYYNLGADLIKGVADKDPKKIGKHTITGIPIVSEDIARKEADYFFILPWGFAKQFMEKEKGLGYKGQFIVSTPNFKIYD